MSREFEGSVWGISGKYKKVDRAPIILRACDHYLIEKNKKLFKKSVIQIHGKLDGSITCTKMEID